MITLHTFNMVVNKSQYRKGCCLPLIIMLEKRNSIEPQINQLKSKFISS